MHFWELEAFTREETEATLRVLRQQEYPGNAESFTEVKRNESTEFLYQSMMAIAQRADREAGWGLLDAESGPRLVDSLIYDRFGPRFSAPEFKWHCDAADGDPDRKVSVVAYFTDPNEYEGGKLQIEIPAADGEDNGRIEMRTYGPGWVVAFPSKGLRHCVTPVTKGERRSVLLIAG